MEGRDEGLIDRYLAHEASAEELREVEERSKHDATFRQKLVDSELAFQALRLHEREELRNRFRKRDEILDKSSGEDPPRNRITPWLLVIAFIGLGILIWKLIPETTPSISPAPVRLQDSLPTSTEQKGSIDTSTHQELQQSPQPNQGEDSDRKESKPIAEAELQGDKLFAAYFSPYADDMMDPAVRGDGELTPLEKFQLAYWEKRYADALIEFPAISATMRQNDNIRFMQANALMANGKINDAQKILQSIRSNGKSRYLSEVHWYLGLCELRRGRMKNAREHLEEYVQIDNTINKAKAENLLLVISY